MNFRVQIQFGQALSGLICEFESPPLLAAAAAAAAAAQADGQTAHSLHGENDSCECLHVCFPQSEKQLSLTHLPSSLTLCGCPRRRA